MQKYIIYGAGRKGKVVFDFLEYLGMEDLVVAFCDRNYKQIKEIRGIPVVSYSECKKRGMPFIIGVGETFREEIENILKNDYQKFYELPHLYTDVLFASRNLTDFNRDYCAFHHVDGMDWYYQAAEDKDSLGTFWKRGGDFYDLFSRLDLSNVIELGCGRGRHVPQYISSSEHVTLVDILEKNIDYVKQRFKNIGNVCYYKNNGMDLSELASSQYTALFTYDAMVHFELMDIAKYLEDTYRVLKSGGMALFHHSNNHNDYKISFTTGFSGRNYMSKELFAYLAYRVGFEIVEQRTIDWENVRELDCITLVRK